MIGYSKFVLLLQSIFSKINTYILGKRKNVSIGRKSVVFYKSDIVNKSLSGGVIIGDFCLIGRTAKGYHSGMPFYTQILNDGVKSNIVIGNKCRLNGAYIHAQKNIVIGDNCVFATGVSIIDSNGHELYSCDRTVGRDEPVEIEIGSNVWIGLNAVILKGSVIGDNSVISANSVVKGCFPRNSLISGNPGKLVKILNIENNERNKDLRDRSRLCGPAACKAVFHKV